MSSDFLKNAIALASFLSLIGWNWDAWWHISIGRDQTLAPPHLVQYMAVITVLATSALLFYRTKRGAYKALFFSHILLMVAAIIDVGWHNIVGREKLISPLIIWSPPHIMGFLSAFVGFLFILREWIVDYHVSKNSLIFLRIVLVAAVVASLLHIIIFPLEPIGWHHLLNSWGLIFTMAAAVTYLLYLCSAMPKSGVVTLTMITVVSLFGFEAKEIATGVSLPPHVDLPFWIRFIAAFFATTWLDFIETRKYNPLFLGGIIGLIAYAVFFLFWDFIKIPPGFSIDKWDIVSASLIGGVIGGIFFRLLTKIFLLSNKNELSDNYRGGNTN